MGLRLIYGKAGTGKSEFCFKEIAKKIDTDKIIIITPEQFSFTLERKLMETVGTNAVLNAEVITLSRMAHRVIQEVGGENKTALSKCGKAMLIFSILQHNKKDLKFLGKTDENIDIIMRAITEFKQHNITLELLQEEIKRIDDTYLKTKLKDMELIYGNFENHLQDNYIDETDRITILASELENTNIVNDAIIYIDEFVGFTSQELDVIKKLVELSKQVNITVCTDSLFESTNPDSDIFYTNKFTAKKLMQLVEQEDMEPPVFLDTPYRFKTNELLHLEGNIFKTKSTKYTKNVENISLFLAKNQYSEIENLAKQIINLVVNKQYRFKEISVITKNLETYSSLIRGIFKKYEIPVFIDEKRELTQNVIVQYILSLLEVLSKNFANEAMFNYLKLGFCDIDAQEIFELENYSIKWGINKNKWKENFEKESDERPQEIERLNFLRKSIVDPLVTLRTSIMENKTAGSISKLLYNFIKEQNIEKKIINKIKSLEELNFVDLVQEYKTSYETILDVMDQMVLIFGKEKLTIDRYLQIFKIGLKNSGLGKIPGTQDQIIVGDVERSRSHKVKAVFILGLNDGSFPSVNKDERFAGDADRDILKSDGLELAKGTIENLYEENFNMYKAFSTAEEMLYLSYASANSNGSTLRPSIILSKIKRMFPNLKEESDVTFTQIENESSYTNLPTPIEQEKIDKLYGSILKTSVSRLEKYRECPFSYFLQYGLRVKEKEELKVHNFDTGSFMHQVIDEFFSEKVINSSASEGKRKRDIQLITDEEIEETVDKIVEEKLSQSRNYIFTATAKYRMLVIRLKRIITKSLKYILESLAYSDFSTLDTEVEFGKKGKFKPIIIELDNEKKVEINGIIDRIDVAKNEDGKYLRIIDYKSSAKNVQLNEVYAGLQIQLLTYLDAVCKEEDFMPAGVLYFQLLEDNVKGQKKMNPQELEDRIRANFKMKGLVLADVKVLTMQDNKIKETISSRVIPAGITKNDKINQKCTSGVTAEEFKTLQDYIPIVIKQIANEMLSGNIELKPYNKNGYTPCTFCSYKSICGFDTKLKDNKFRYIDKMPKDVIIEKMKE